MQKELVNDSIPQEFSHTLSLQVPDLIIRQLEKIKLKHRAEKYRYKEDQAGIDYIRRNIHQGDIVFDIGAHKAGYLYFFLEQLGNSGKVVAFEPQSSLHKYLRKLKDLFEWENVVIESSAVSEKSGTAVLCIPYNNGRTSSPCATIIESHTLFEFQAKETVATISVDEYCFRNKIAPDFLKIDVEGNELSVLKGAATLLQTRKPRILFECEARFVGEKNGYGHFSVLAASRLYRVFYYGGQAIPYQGIFTTTAPEYILPSSLLQ